MDNSKKAAAAITAVMYYIKSEEESAVQMAAGPEAGAAVTPGPHPALNMWGASGRLAQMQIRTLMQMKTFRGSKI